MRLKLHSFSASISAQGISQNRPPYTGSQAWEAKKEAAALRARVRRRPMNTDNLQAPPTTLTALAVGNKRHSLLPKHHVPALRAGLTLMSSPTSPTLTLEINDLSSALRLRIFQMPLVYILTLPTSSTAVAQIYLVTRDCSPAYRVHRTGANSRISASLMKEDPQASNNGYMTMYLLPYLDDGPISQTSLYQHISIKETGYLRELYFLHKIIVLAMKKLDFMTWWSYN